MSWRTKYKQANGPEDLKRANHPYKSWLPNKKLVVRAVKGNKEKIIHFGQVGYQDYTEHKDKERRRRYLARASKIRNKRGQLTKNDPLSANHWAIKILW